MTCKASRVIVSNTAETVSTTPCIHLSDPKITLCCCYSAASAFLQHLQQTQPPSCCCAIASCFDFLI